MEAEPGDLAAHHPATLHSAGSNTALHRTRRALGFIFYSAQAQESAEWGHYQDQLRHKLQQEGRI